MSLFTKIKQDLRARHRRRLAAKLHKMIEAAADENDGAFVIKSTIVSLGDVIAYGNDSGKIVKTD